MADSSGHGIPQLDVDTAELEALANENFQAGSPAMGFGLILGEMTGLQVEMLPGVALDTAGTPTKITLGLSHSCTDDATNYCSLEPGSPPTITYVTAAPSGWPGPLASGGVALYSFVAADGALTWTDYRLAPAASGGGLSTLPGVTFSITGSGPYTITFTKGAFSGAIDLT